MPEADRLALVQQPHPPVKRVASTNFPQADGAVVKLAVVFAVVRASNSVLFVIVVVARSLGLCWRRRRLGKTSRWLWQTWQLGQVRARWWRRRSARYSSESSDEKSLRDVHRGSNVSGCVCKSYSKYAHSLPLIHEPFPSQIQKQTHSSPILLPSHLVSIPSLRVSACSR